METIFTSILMYVLVRITKATFLHKINTKIFVIVEVKDLYKISFIIKL
jgi:hypothetical protein